jgi:hypothetical protein
MKKRSTRILSVLLAVLLFCSALLPCSFAATAEEWDENWDRLKNDSSAVSLSPGSDPSSMNFTWLTPTDSGMVMFQIATDSSMKNGEFLKVERTHTALYGWKNDVTAENLKSDTTYYYRVAEKGKWSKTYSFNTGNEKDYSVLFVSDTQIGRSGDRKLDEVLKHDSLGWNNTLEAAVKYAPDISFIISSGDQVESAITQEQHNLFFNPELMRSLPAATAIGNHDFYYPLYSIRSNHPNRFDRELLQCPAGKGYYFKRGEALFIVLNSNNVLTYEHEELIKEAMEFYPDALWRVVVMHYSIYSRNEEDNFYRPLFSRIFDKYDIDLVLSGHDHIYTRSALLRGNERVKNGGTLYLEASTASGCNYGGQPDATPWYAEKCIQLRTPTYVLLKFTQGKISIKALRSDTNEVFDSYELTKATPSNTEYKDSLLQRLYLFFADKIFKLRDIIF